MLLRLGDEVRTPTKKKIKEIERLQKLADSFVTDDPYAQMQERMMHVVVERMRAKEMTKEEMMSPTSPKSRMSDDAGGLVGFF